MTLSERDVRILRLSTAIVLGRWSDVERIRRSAPSGEPDRAWREAVLQTHLFSGFPRQVEAYEVLDRVGGLGPLEPGEHAGEPDRPDRGDGLFRLIYGSKADELKVRMASFHGDFGDWVQGHAYGRVLARPGLSADRREILAVGALIALGAERQLAGHVRGSLRSGATRADLVAVADVLSDMVSEACIERGRAIIERLLARHGED